MKSRILHLRSLKEYIDEDFKLYAIQEKKYLKLCKHCGKANYFESLNRYPELRRKSRIRSIHSSLTIENNQLSLFQVEDVIN